jgi:hypothetical protein
VTRHPTAAWTLQQLREAIPSDHTYRFILHDRDAIFSIGFDASLAHLGLEGKCCNFENGDEGGPERNWAARFQVARSNSWSMN